MNKEELKQKIKELLYSYGELRVSDVIAYLQLEDTRGCRDRIRSIFKEFSNEEDYELLQKSNTFILKFKRYEELKREKEQKMKEILKEDVKDAMMLLISKAEVKMETVLVLVKKGVELKGRDVDYKNIEIKKEVYYMGKLTNMEYIELIKKYGEYIRDWVVIGLNDYIAMLNFNIEKGFVINKGEFVKLIDDIIDLLDNYWKLREMLITLCKDVKLIKLYTDVKKYEQMQKEREKEFIKNKLLQIIK